MDTGCPHHPPPMTPMSPPDPDYPVEGKMTIYVRMWGKKTIEIRNISPYAKVQSLKELIYGAEKLCVWHQRLVYGGVELEDSFTLHDHNIPDGQQLYLFLRNAEGESC
ncbi:hypothetical protein CBR_g72019 [Chara braunii]|uniref:Ubiquitin-like domain-containing protein n=1 Tax=Chara braunii TaxID=69332 RepID=A0A388MG12_CHABU|nr:hypothetical protein CBR_g72019 [Chara braunii]|eukprot:GBG93496.1 hypothetical protein CBR_g72019 [Chara braunii]